MTSGSTVQKVKIKTDEQVRKRKRKRPETERSKNNKKRLKVLQDGLSDVKARGNRLWGDLSSWFYYVIVGGFCFPLSFLF